ncbi:Long-chain acyl-CoA thioesterase FadM [Chryseobacterium carnipullorum]|uniref:Long-chain acyl-CoA thioesterase FadM n=2 Tax=Chryseobacterium carnipullorum TaxID=1124835 RepID=A0A376DP99_CHRCU|nr:Long-chain acyl-CoA thioesterase FadM [Chryseobacterium carnipullorum]
MISNAEEKIMDLVYQKEIHVTEEHIDKNHHVNNVQYVHWVEEIAGEHWDSLKHKTEFAEFAWILVDHHIQYKKQVFLHDVITVKTYPKPPEGIKQPRKVEFYCKDKLVVDSDTLWVLVDLKTQKIKRLESDWLDNIVEES